MIDFLKGTVTPKDWISLAAILGVAAALAAGYFFVVYSGQQQRLAAIAADNVLVVADLTKARETSTGIETLRAMTKEIEVVVKEFKERLPTEREILSLYREVETLANAEGLTPSVAPLPPTQTETKEIIPYKITVSGGFHAIAGYINSLERYRRYLKVTDLSIGPWEDGVCEATFKLETYRFIVSEPTPGAAQ